MRYSVLMLVFAVGCGSKPSQPSSGDANQQPGVAAHAPTTMGKPNPDETVALIREFFTDPARGVGFLNVQVEQVSEAVPAPKELVPGGGEGWAYSVNMTCENVVGDRMHNKNWLVVIGRDAGKARVKDYYNDLTKMSNSPVGKEWFAKNGFGEPTID
jgi:hypothetical protein